MAMPTTRDLIDHLNGLAHAYDIEPADKLRTLQAAVRLESLQRRVDELELNQRSLLPPIDPQSEALRRRPDQEPR